MQRITTPPRTMEQVKGFYTTIHENIQRYGHHLIGVMAGAHTPPFTYSIGLSDKLGYELFICGLRNDYAATVINDLVPYLVNGTFTPNNVIPKKTVTNFPLMLAECTKELDWLYDDFVLQIERYYGDRKPVVQLLMSDKQGRTPQHPDFDIEYMAQFQPIFCEID